MGEGKIAKNQFILLTGRTVYQGTGKEYGKLSKDYFESVSICEIDPDDLKELGIRANENIKIVTDFGSVVIKAVESPRAPHRKIIYIPYGPYASMVVSPKTHGTGMPSYKGIPASIEHTSEKVLEIKELLKNCYGKE